jgi:hypothetical protein
MPEVVDNFLRIAAGAGSQHGNTVTKGMGRTKTHKMV